MTIWRNNVIVPYDQVPYHVQQRIDEDTMGIGRYDIWMWTKTPNRILNVVGVDWQPQENGRLVPRLLIRSAA